MTFGADIHAIDEAEMDKVVSRDVYLEVLQGGFKFIEGPVWFNDDKGGYLLFSDQPANAIYRWVQGSPATIFRQPSQVANGNIKDLQGRLVTCEQALRRVAVTEPDGTIQPIVDVFEGKRFNSPNDVIVKSDGTVWFTDPPYGVPKGEKREIDTQNVFRHDPRTGKTMAVITDMDMPNGLCFSPDEKILYVAESQSKGPRDIKAFDVNDDGTVSNGRVFASLNQARKPGVPDGMRVDRDGRLWSSAGDGVQIFASNGKQIGTILTPETVTNLTFGGPDGTTLYMTATKTLCRIKVKVPGATDR